MQLLNEETVAKIRMMSPDKQKQVINGIAKMLAVRPHEHDEELEELYPVEDNH